MISWLSSRPSTKSCTWSAPKRRPKARCCSGVRRWSRKKITQFSVSAWRISPMTLSPSGCDRSMPPISAPSAPAMRFTVIDCVLICGGPPRPGRNIVSSVCHYRTRSLGEYRMNLIHPGPEEGMLCLRAVRTAVERSDGIPPAARAMMTAAQQVLLSLDADLDTLPTITPAELAAGLKTPGLAEQVVQAMLLGVLADGEPVPECEARVEACAKALGVDIPGLRTVRLLCEHHMALFRLAFLRRSNFRD